MVKSLKPENNTPVTLSLKCGSCIFFNTLKFEKFDNVCSKLGIIPQNTPCKHYKNNAKAITLKNDKGKKLAEVISEFPSKDLDIIASAVKQEKVTRKVGFKLGQRVFVRIYPGEYLSNYMVATVLQADKKGVYVEGKTMKVRAILSPSSVFDTKKWKAKKAAMIRKCAFLDPDLRGHVKPKFKEPLDEVPESFVEQVKLHEKKSRLSERDLKEKLHRRESDLTEVFTIRGQK